jgi:hypothetical protein
MTTWLSWALVVISIVDWIAAAILVYAAHPQPRLQILYDRARAAVAYTLATALLAILGQLVVHGIRLPEPWALLIFVVALLLPGLIAPLFLIDYLLGRYDEEED